MSGQPDNIQTDISNGYDSAANSTPTNDDYSNGADTSYTDDGGGQEQQHEEYDPPSRWSAEEQTLFRQLPPQAQKTLLDKYSGMEKDYTQKTQQISNYERQLQDRARHYERLEQVVAPRRAQWARDGMDEVTAINQLASLSDFAAQDPYQFIQWFAQSRGIDLARMVQPQEQGFVDPAIKYANDKFKEYDQRLQQYLSPLQQQLQQTQQVLAMQQQAAYGQQLGSVRGQISQFVSATGQDGKPLYPEASDRGVQDSMAMFIKSGQAHDLASAYDMAVHANPSTRKKLQATQEWRQQQEARARSARAANAGSSISGTGRSNGRGPGASVREELERAFAAHGGRV